MTAETPAKSPVKVLRIDDVSVSIFARNRMVNGETITFHSASFSRSFADRDGKRKYAKTFDTEDLPKVAQLAAMAGDYIRGVTYP